MQSSRGLFRVCKISPFSRLNLKRQLDKVVLQQRRQFSHDGMRNPDRNGKFIFRTAILTGTVLVGGLVIKYKSKTLNSHTNNVGQGIKQPDENEYWRHTSSLSMSEAVNKSRDLLLMKKVETGSPGMTVAVSVDGKIVWAEGFGYSDLENRVKCTPESVFRIASISKAITMATVAKLIERGDLDIDKPVQYYVPEFPEKTWEGQKVEITTRQLLSHLGGIRHYNKFYMTKMVIIETKESDTNKANSKKDSQKSVPGDIKGEKAEEEPRGEMTLGEYYITNHYKSVQESLALFKDDPLVHKPGSKFLYTTHGWTLISAVVEKAAKMPFEEYLRQTLDELGLENTYLEEHQPLIKNRGRHYVKNKKKRIENAPFVDLSYKWAGGGLISNVLDVVQFGNAMLFSYQARPFSIASSQPTSTSCNSEKKQNLTQTNLKESKENVEDNDDKLSGFLKPDTMKMMWTPYVIPEAKWEGIVNAGYGMGWSVCRNKHEHAFCKDQKFYACHTGGAIGASSVLMVVPRENALHANEKNKDLENKTDGVINKTNTAQDLQEASLFNSKPPKGVVVAIIVNMTSVGLNKTAYDIARIFECVGYKM